MIVFLKYFLVAQLFNAEPLHLKLGSPNIYGGAVFLKGDTAIGGEATFGFFYSDGKWTAGFQPYLKTVGFPEYPDKLWNSVFAGGFKKGFVSYHHSSKWLDLTVKFGRDSIKIGPMGLIFSSNGTYLDMGFIRASIEKLWNAELVFGTGMLDPMDSANRYLSFHGIEVKPDKNRGLRFGWAESVIYGGKNQLPVPYYLNPLTLYYTYQVFNETPFDRESNVFWDLWAGYTGRNWDMVGELLIDDYPYISVRGEKGKLAWGVELNLDFGEALIKAQYRGATRWTYTHRGHFTNYLFHDRPIGDSLGADFERFCIELKNGQFWTMAAVTFKGEGSLHEYPPVGQWPPDNFLTGVVERRFELGVGVEGYRVFRNISLNLKLISSYVVNYAHRDGVDKFFLRAVMSLDFRPL